LKKRPRLRGSHTSPVGRIDSFVSKPGIGLCLTNPTIARVIWFVPSMKRMAEKQQFGKSSCSEDTFPTFGISFQIIKITKEL